VKNSSLATQINEVEPPRQSAILVQLQGKPAKQVTLLLVILFTVCMTADGHQFIAFSLINLLNRQEPLHTKQISVQLAIYSIRASRVTKRRQIERFGMLLFRVAFEGRRCIAVATKH
jgi:hypothetical protein